MSLLERQSSRVLLEANLKCRGMVIVADTFFQGWVATVDGQNRPIYEAYGFLRGERGREQRHHDRDRQGCGQPWLAQRNCQHRKWQQRPQQGHIIAQSLIVEVRLLR